jgi:hypothetical protein
MDTKLELPNISLDLTKVYDESIKPITQPAAKMVGIVPRTANAAFFKTIGKKLMLAEYEEKALQKIIDYRLENIDPSKITEPDLYVAFPALLAMSYSMNNEKLRDLYANLLASAMNTDKKALVHPAYVEIIKQMSPLDAVMLEKTKNKYPVAKLRMQNYMGILPAFGDDSPYRTESAGFDADENISAFPDDEYDSTQIRASIGNLKRLGLINTNYGPVAAGEENTAVYRKIENQAAPQRSHTLNPNATRPETVLIPGICELTAFGEAFMNICSS